MTPKSHLPAITADVNRCWWGNTFVLASHASAAFAAVQLAAWWGYPLAVAMLAFGIWMVHGHARLRQRVQRLQQRARARPFPPRPSPVKSPRGT